MNDEQNTQSGNFRQMTPDELEANGFPRDLHTRPAEAQQETRTWAHTGPHTDSADRSAPYGAPIQAARRAAKSTKGRTWAVRAGIAALALFIGVGIGSANTPDPVEVTKEVPGPERTVEKRVNVPTTPAVCLDALTLNEEAFDISAEAMGAIARYDMAAAKVQNAKLTALAPKVNAAKAACRASR